MSRQSLMLKKFLIAGFAFMLSGSVDAQNFNQALADSLGADPYGMKQYVLVILKTGSNSIADKKITDSLFAGHLQNIQRLADAGKLVVAGPFGQNDQAWRGIFILNVSSIKEARLLLETDPVIRVKLLEADCYPWYGSAALPLYLPVHQTIQKEKF